MKRTITPEEMKAFEQKAISAGYASSEELMERAADALAIQAEKMLTARVGTVLCFCGTGNNGGDGVAAVRLLLERIPTLKASIRFLKGKHSPDLLREESKLRFPPERLEISEEDGSGFPGDLVLIVDALFGTGLNRPLEGTAMEAVLTINSLREAGIPVLSADIPSGLNGETGLRMGEAVQADATVTFHRPKIGLFLQQGPDLTGKIFVAPIGLEGAEKDLGAPEGWKLADNNDLYRWLPSRKKTAHKGNCGKVLIFAGSFGMAGAAALSAEAALRTGAGLVTVACPEKIVSTVQTLCPCATCLPLPENAEEAAVILSDKMDSADAFAAGCGLGQSNWACTVLSAALGKLTEKPVLAVLDADALTLLPKARPSASWLIPPVLTPHPGEAARLLGCSIQKVVEDPEAALEEIAHLYSVSCILKGARSLMICGEERMLNPFGTPAMAKGGSGDTLTGVLAALLAGKKAGLYSMEDWEILSCGCAMHGLAGEEAEKHYGERGVLATDLCRFLGLQYGEIPESNSLLPFQENNAFQNGVLGRLVSVCVENPFGSKTGDAPEKLNRGYVLEVLKENNEWQDACVFGVHQPLEWFSGRVAAILKKNGSTVWMVADDKLRPTKEELILEAAMIGFTDVTTE